MKIIRDKKNRIIPITLEQVKTQCIIDLEYGDEDEKLDRFLKSTINTFENYISGEILLTDVTIITDDVSGDEFKFKVGGFSSLSGVTVNDIEITGCTVITNDYSEIDYSHNNHFILQLPESVNAGDIVKIYFKTGFDEVPSDILDAILRGVNDKYDANYIDKRTLNELNSYIINYWDY
ncbi:hypothetical protein [Carboxylicivirga sp. RSCT41]|uniref:hypothetical protein n=1 Tax=Carboxylicivirga agarovorans TaxID=3417570 RepID=UPI003D328E21